ncbi:MAG: T9SS type A sorting domain-containing protein [Crocinitomicaceae bacterium]|nr:T9SS type A sorting domain-containing protein [Crocinitomicaceae bacterium]
MSIIKLTLLLIALPLGLLSQTNQTLTLTHGGLQRTYKIYVPAIYDNNSSAPLLLNLHGYTSDMVEQEVYGDFRAIADTAGFILVHPNGTLDLSGNRFWNAFSAFGVDDIGFLNALVQEIKQNYNINDNKIYSVGMSNGGVMSYILACQANSPFAAVGSVTGSMPVGSFQNCQANRPTPIIQIHGTDDQVLPIGGNAQFEPIAQVVDFWVGHNDIPLNSSIFIELPDINTNDNSTAHQYIYCSDNNKPCEVEYLEIQNGGHTWPGSIVPLPNMGATNQDINASVEIWRFFSQFSKDQLANNSSLPLVLQLRLYPNPSNDKQVFISSSRKVEEVKIFNSLGQSVPFELVTTDELMKIKTINKGSYTIQLLIDNQWVTKKWIVE